MTAAIAGILKSAPEWVRTDLAARDTALRRRAEETLAAIVAAALSPPAVD